MGSSADRHLSVHGAMSLPSQTWHLPSYPAAGCRADQELKLGADGCCRLLPPLGFHGGISSWRATGGEAGLGSDRSWVPGRGGNYLVGEERHLSQLCLAGVRGRASAPPAKSRGPGVAPFSRADATARPEK